MNPNEAGTIANSLENSNRSPCQERVMIKLLSDQENDVDRREEAFGKRAVGKCRDYKQPSVR